MHEYRLDNSILKYFLIFHFFFYIHENLMKNTLKLYFKACLGIDWMKISYCESEFFEYVHRNYIMYDVVVFLFHLVTLNTACCCAEHPTNSFNIKIAVFHICNCVYKYLKIAASTKTKKKTWQICDIQHFDEFLALVWSSNVWRHTYCKLWSILFSVLFHSWNEQIWSTLHKKI